MDKVLLVARLGKFFSDFEISNIQILQEMGYEVWCAGNFDGDNHKLDPYHVHKVHIDFVRSPLSRLNIKGYRQLVKLMQENDFKLVHCHMPVGSVFARLAAHRTKTSPVFYTAHGFQFVKGGPVRDWIIFYPVEKFLSRYTDVLITINQEDYKLASSKFHMMNAVYIHGIGIDSEKFSRGNDIRQNLCKEFNIPDDRYLLLSVGELSKRKNHEVVLRGLAELLKESREIRMPHYIICGVGVLEEYLKNLSSELGIEKHVTFLGWRDDIADLCKSVDAFVFPSKREGLPVALMEAMAAGLPCIVSEARGNTELIQSGRNGIICSENIPEEYTKAIAEIRNINLENVRNASESVLRPYRKAEIADKMKELYKSVGL